MEVLRRISKIFKAIIIEVIIIFSFIFILNNYIGKAKVTINADAYGYYDYLISAFIHHDFIRKDVPVKEDSLFYKRIISLGRLSVDYKGFKVNKCSSGTAILELPFFTYAYLNTPRDNSDNDGYQAPYHKAIFYAAIFYLFLTLFLLKKILELYDVKKFIIVFTQILLALGTSVTHYANYDAGYSHVYSLFANTAFIYFIKSYFKNKNLNHFILACGFLGFTIIIRQLNGLIFLFVPFLAGSFQAIKEGAFHLLSNKKGLLIGIILFCVIVFIQCILWYLQTGYFVLYSYQGEGFNFLKPEISNILFSYRKGLFVYTPVLAVSLISMLWLLYKREYFKVISWLFFFLLLTYIFSSWWAWDFGCSYGLRGYIEFYTIFFIPIAMILSGISAYIRNILIILAFLTIPLNIIQTYQYDNFILHWQNMSKEKYRKVFLKTGDNYKGLLWKKEYDYSAYSVIKEINIGDVCSPINTNKIIYTINCNEINDFENVSIIQVKFNNEFNEKNHSRIILSILDTATKHSYYWSQRYLMQFAEKELNEWQTGLYNFEFDPMIDNAEKIITLELKTKNQNDYLEDLRIIFLKQH